VTPAAFVKRRQQDWGELEQLLRAPGGASAPGRAERTSRMAALFRSACADLAHARTAGFPEDVIDYLNGLTARCHNRFYVSPPFPRDKIWRFFTHLFPLSVRRNAVYVVAGLLLFYAPLAGTASLAWVDEELLYEIIPEPMLKQYEKMHSRGHAAGRDEASDVMMTGFYVRNNIGIAFQSFAAGIFFGVGSILVTLFNGVVIGAVMGFIIQTPSAPGFLSFIVAHGPLELTAICIACGAGLRLGFGAVIAGRRRRGASLRLAAREAVLLVLGAACMLALAALIEGFVSPSSLPVVVKAGVGALTAVLMVIYLGLYGARCYRRAQEEG
jgi:uncharacterized membrane protein SpoIIM required for sporulation